jgi:hypothetical protein
MMVYNVPFGTAAAEMCEWGIHHTDKVMWLTNRLCASPRCHYSEMVGDVPAELVDGTSKMSIVSTKGSFK